MFLVSVLFIAVTSVLFKLCRDAVTRLFPSHRDRLKMVFGREFLATLEICVGAFEGGIVIETEGLQQFSLVVFGCCVWRFLTWSPEDTACPYSVLGMAVSRKISGKEVLARLFAQLLAAAFSLKAVSFFWDFGLHPRHQGKAFLESWYRCGTHVSTDILTAAVVEALGTCVLAFGVMALPHLTSNMELLFVPLASALIVATVLLGIEYTGGYYNPILASAKTFGCRGTTYGEHLFVYWVSSAVGYFVAESLYEICRPRLPKKLRSE
ncbi:unnamed protein product [Cyprideis torosa]|uniref:Uncharacterized protein n=1 Tax=Cyprideis torosa TaxID=163714 RepID=A0A7R8W6H8_9CRUS|nr:unnamed protein product [Cyprideis torosa]CAG0881355.1 unnamed protein product [Cyprideis torosa]